MSGTTPLIPYRRFYVADQGTLAAALDTLPRSRAHPDADLLVVCRQLWRLWQRRDRLFANGQPRHRETKHARLMRAIDEAANPLLEHVCNNQSMTLDGHRARAAAFLATDESGLLIRANRRDLPAERLLAALVIDLLGSRSP